jgi:hypothetical protein
MAHVKDTQEFMQENDQGIVEQLKQLGYDERYSEDMGSGAYVNKHVFFYAIIVYSPRVPIPGRYLHRIFFDFLPVQYLMLYFFCVSNKKFVTI